jgi:hypothetical protein
MRYQRKLNQRLAVSCRDTCFHHTLSRENLPDHLARHIGQAKVAALKSVG